MLINALTSIRRRVVDGAEAAPIGATKLFLFIAVQPFHGDPTSISPWKGCTAMNKNIFVARMEPFQGDIDVRSRWLLRVVVRVAAATAILHRYRPGRAAPR